MDNRLAAALPARDRTLPEPPVDPARRPLLRMEGITKTFFGNTANDAIDFELYPNEICALLGENGAGKSSLMKILFGLYRADAGHIYLEDQEVRIASPQKALELGIGMVHQHFNLVPRHRVWENITLIAKQGFLLNKAAACRRIRELSEEFGLKVDPEAFVWQLSVGERQRVEIIKALFQGARILILDEPTAVLTPQEAERLFEVLKGMVARGLSIIFISHKLKEVLAVSHRVVVLRHGKLIKKLAAAQTTVEELTRYMVGEDSLPSVEYKSVPLGEEVLRLENLCARNNLKVQTLKNVSLSIRAGEILGLAGVSGNGQKDLADILSGMTRPESGRVYFKGERLPLRAPAALIASGWGRVPEDRKGVGSLLNFSLLENSLLEVHARPAFRKGCLLDLKKARNHVKELIAAYDVRPPLPDAPAHSLSGGNLQKLILARELSLEPRMILVSQPTWGLDVRAVHFIQSLLLREKEKGAAILLISEDLDEVLALSDRVAVIYEGEIVEILPRAEAARTRIGLLMAGVRSGEGRSPAATPAPAVNAD